MAFNVITNPDQSDKIEITLQPPKEYERITHKKLVSITRRSGRKLHIEISGLVHEYQNVNINKPDDANATA